MAEPGTVVITGASRGLGLASAAHLWRRGWHVVGAMRSPDDGLDRIRAATGAAAGDPRLTAVRLDLDDPASIAAAAKEIERAVGAPYGLVHNAARISVGCVEEMPAEEWARIFTTNLFGPVRLTQALLPAMRNAARGRIVVVSSQGAVRGIPSIGAYSASKGAVERWAEALAEEIAPFGLGVTALVAGAHDTGLTETTHSYADPDGPYARHHAGLLRSGLRMMRFARSPDRFPPSLATALADTAPFVRRPAGPDARAMILGARFAPAGLYRAASGRAMGLPRPGSLRSHPIRTAALTPRHPAD